MPSQLRMIWPVPKKPAEVTPPEGYTIRSFRKGDEEQYVSLLNNNDLGEWTAEKLQPILENLLSPEGIYFVVHNHSLVATACSLDEGIINGKKTADLGWLSVNQSHRGKGLGYLVCAQVIKHLLDRRYEDVYLLTDHWRYGAVKTYLKLGFEPEIDTPERRFFWTSLSQQFGITLTEKPIKAKYVKLPKGEEIAWRTLNLERVNEPCIISPWCMKREFFQNLTHRQNIYESAPQVAIESFIRVGANLSVYLLMPSPQVEHLACDPLTVNTITAEPTEIIETPNYKSPEDVRDYIETLPKPDTFEKNFDVETEADKYAKHLLNLREMSQGEILSIGGFGGPDFTGGYTQFGYENYLTALLLYPEHLKRYFAYTGEQGRLRNISIVRAVEKYNLAPFVYGGEDICFNSGPICSLEILDTLYFPYFAKAVEPLHRAGIKIIWHCDGDVRPILDRLINQIGVSGLQGFQEETGCTLETIASHKSREGKKLILWGSISVTTTLPYGTVDDVKQDVERCFRVAAPGGGFALASSSSILPETPIQNIFAMYDYGIKFGKEFLSGC